MLQAVCVEWALVLGLLLMDAGVVLRTVDCARAEGGVDANVMAKILQGSEELFSWAEEEW